MKTDKEIEELALEMNYSSDFEKNGFVDGYKKAQNKQLRLYDVIRRLRERLEINAGRLAEPLLKQGKQLKEDKDCHKAFLMLAHLAEIEDYLNGL